MLAKDLFRGVFVCKTASAQHPRSDVSHVGCGESECVRISLVQHSEAVREVRTVVTG
jgi:hypothetical protein